MCILFPINKQDIQEILVGNTCFKDAASSAESFNDYFINIGPNLAHAIPTSSRSFHSFLDRQNPESLFFCPGTKGRGY